MINGVAHGPMRGHHHLPAAHAELQGRRHHLRRAVAGAGVPGHQGSGGRPRARSTGSSRRAASSPRRPAARRTRNAILGPQGQRRRGDGRGRSASAAAPAWPPARTRRRCCSPPPRSPTSACCRRASRSGSSGPAAWWADGHRRGSAAAPCTASARRPAQRDQHRDHLPDESRLPAGLLASPRPPPADRRVAGARSGAGGVTALRPRSSPDRARRPSDHLSRSFVGWSLAPGALSGQAVTAGAGAQAIVAAFHADPSRGEIRSPRSSWCSHW